MTSNNLVVTQNKNVLQDVAPPARVSGKEIVYKYIVFLPLFIVSISIALAVAYINIRYKIPIYNSTISILIKDDKSGKGGGDDLILENLTSYKKKTNLSNEVELIKSVSMLSRVVNMLNLNWQYFNEGNVKKTEIYKGSSKLRGTWIELLDSSASANVILVKRLNSVYIEFGPNRYKKVLNGDIVDFPFGKMRIFFDVNEMNKDSKYYITYQPTNNVAGIIVGALSIKQLSKETTILKIGIDLEVPQKGRDILNALVNVYNNVNVEDKNRIVENTIRFIDERLTVLSDDLSSIEGQLQDFKQKHGIIDIETQSAAEFTRVNGYETQISENEVQEEMISLVKDYVLKPQSKYTLVPSTLGLQDLTLTALVTEFNDLQLKREEKLKSIPLQNPIIKTLENQIEKVRKSILEDITNLEKRVKLVQKGTKNTYGLALEKLKAYPLLQRELLEILRQQGIKEKLYLFLLQKREESEITRASTIGNSLPIDPAVSGGQVSPDVSGIYKNSLIIGFLIPVLFIYLIDLLNDKIVVRNDIARATSAPIIGEVAHHSSQNRVLVVSNKDRSVLAEQFRILRTNIGFLLGPNIKSPVLLVTSSIAGEGKTFCSMNLAAVFGIAGKKTVILELDLRKPKIAKSLGMINEKGITHFMSGQVSAESLPIPIPNTDNLYIVPAGIIPPNPSEMIMDVRMNEFITYLKTRFEVIIIDSAPVGLVSDSKIIAQLADATVYIVRQRYTVKKQLPFINELYTQSLLPNIGILVNDVKIGGVNSYYGYGYGYGYGYSYNYSYNYRYGNDKVTPWSKLKSLFKI